MPQLTETCAIYRMALQENGTKTLTAVYARLPCLRVPVSKFDVIAAPLSAATTTSPPSEFFRSEGRQSTDLFLVPAWVTVLPDDELQRGRFTNNDGQVVPYRYTVSGMQTFETLAYQDTLALYTYLTQ